MKQEIERSFYSNHLSHILILVLLVPLLLLIYFTFSTSQSILAQTTSVENVEEYKNTLFGLSIDYPSTWITDEFEKRIKNDDIVGINNIVLFCPNPNTLKQVPSAQINNTNTICTNPEKSFDVYVHNIPAGM